MSKEPTSEQKAIIDCSGNIVVTAKPGSGKTYTVVAKIMSVLKDLPSHKGVIAISYTNKASSEIIYRCKSMGIDIKSSFFGTIDKFYISEIVIPFSRHFLGKVVDIEIVSIKDYPEYSNLENLETIPSQTQCELLLKSLMNGMLFLELDGQYAYYILRNCPEARQYIKSRYRFIVIDEYQDCGFIQDAVFNALISMNIIGMAVGDADQAIFGFAKRFPEYLMKLIGRNDFHHFELSKNFRCHPSIAQYSLSFLNPTQVIDQSLEKRIFETRIEGDEHIIAEFIDENLAKIVEHFNLLSQIKIENQNVVILTSSNWEAGFYHDVLSMPSKCFVETPLDKSPYEYDRFYVQLITACFSKMSSADFTDLFFSYEFDKRKYKKMLSLTESLFRIDDKMDSLHLHVSDFLEIANLVFGKIKIDNKNLSAVLNDFDLLNSYVPPKSDEISIMTFHKSKGLEFNIVFHMDLYKDFFPSFRASSDDIEQNKNTHYVAITRAIDACYFLLGTIRTSKKGQRFRTFDSPFLGGEYLQSQRKIIRYHHY